MQVLGSYSEEGDVEGLNFVNGIVKKIDLISFLKFRIWVGIRLILRIMIFLKILKI